MKNSKKGFTLIEIVVAVAIFVSVIVIATLSLVYAIRAQRYNLAYEELTNQTSFVIDYMSRSLRMAKKQLPGPEFPSCMGINENYEVAGGNSIKFIHYKHEIEEEEGEETEAALFCAKFELDDGRLYERNMSTGEVFALTSESLTVQNFSVNILGTSNEQQLVVIELRIQGREETQIEIKTSISQRDLNI